MCAVLPLRLRRSGADEFHTLSNSHKARTYHNPEKECVEHLARVSPQHTRWPCSEAVLFRRCFAQDLSLIRNGGAADQLFGCGLAGAVFTDKAGDVPSRNGHVQMIHRIHSAEAF